MIYQCNICDFNCDISRSTEAMIDHVYGHMGFNDFRLTREETIQLQTFIYDMGFVSYEFHSGIVEMLRKINKYLGEDHGRKNNPNR